METVSSKHLIIVFFNLFIISEKRIRSALEKLVKSRQTSAQGRLDGFFTVVASTTKRPVRAKQFKIFNFHPFRLLLQKLVSGKRPKMPLEPVQKASKRLPSSGSFITFMCQSQLIKKNNTHFILLTSSSQSDPRA